MPNVPRTVRRGRWSADPAPSASEKVGITSLNGYLRQLKRFFLWDPVRDCVKWLVSTHFSLQFLRRRRGPASGIKVQVSYEQHSEKTI